MTFLALEDAKVLKERRGGFVVGFLEPRDMQASLCLCIVHLALVLDIPLIVGIHSRVSYWIPNGGMEAH